MSRVSRPAAEETVTLSIHNEGPVAADVEVVVHGDGVVRSLRLQESETVTVSAPPGSAVDVHTREGTATSTVTRGALFVVRDGRVLVVAG